MGKKNHRGLFKGTDREGDVLAKERGMKPSEPMDLVYP